MNGIPLTAPPLPPVTANPVQAVSPQIPDESGFLHAQTPSMPDMSGLSTFGAAVKKYMGQHATNLANQGRGMQAGQAAGEAATGAKPTPVDPVVQGGAYGSPPPFSGAPATPPSADAGGSMSIGPIHVGPAPAPPTSPNDLELP